jgi:phosphoglycolate phosphatase-like HAD superfamily hydrolase
MLAAKARMLGFDILTATLRKAGAAVSPIRRWTAGLVRVAQAIYVRQCANLKRKAFHCVGMPPARLLRREVPAGVVAGNLTRIGWTKMEHAGMRQYFRFGAFAEPAKDRAGLVKIAIRHARGEGWIDRGSRLSPAGDHPNEILAARANGVPSIAGATGLGPSEELAAHGPDIVVPDLRSLELEMPLR